MKTSKLTTLLALALLAANLENSAIAGNPMPSGGTSSSRTGTPVKQNWNRTMGRQYVPGGQGGFRTLVRDDYARQLRLQPGRTYRLKDGEFVFRGSSGTTSSTGVPTYHLWNFEPRRPAVKTPSRPVQPAAARPAAPARVLPRTHVAPAFPNGHADPRPLRSPTHNF